MFKMWQVSQAVCLGALVGLSVTDIRFRRIPQDILIIATVGVLIYRFVRADMDRILLIGGAAVGVFFFLVSKVTQEGIGYGDSWVILILGIYLGLWKLMEVLIGTFGMIFIAGIICLVKRGLYTRKGLPFLPFLASAYLIHILR